MGSQRPNGESNAADTKESLGIADDSKSEGSVGARLRIRRDSITIDFNALLKTNDRELSKRFWRSIIRHLRCWLAVAAIAVFVLAILAGLIGSRLGELLDALLS